MPKFVAKPIEIEAIQFTGKNWTELQLFTGFRRIDSNYRRTFSPIGTYLPNYLYETGAAELWVDAISTHLVVEVGDWVVRNERGYYPWKRAIFEAQYEPISETV